MHRADVYPLVRPRDPLRFLSPRDLFGAWVAEDAGRVAGHAVLCDATRDASAAVWSRETGSDPASFAVVKRFFGAPDARGLGLGGALLDAACAEAANRGLTPALDVAETDRDAIRLYERRGWRVVARERWSVESEIQLLYFVCEVVGPTSD